MKGIVWIAVKPIGPFNLLLVYRSGVSSNDEKNYREEMADY
jgi:hypothetical protein